MPDLDVAIIGGGIAGLTAAIHLQNDGLNVKIFEASDEPGGRVRTDKVNGFLLDRGFQIFLTAAPEAYRMLDYTSLGFRKFYAGALVRYKDKFYPVGDPFRNPLAIFNLLRVPFTSFADRFKVLALRNQLRRQTVNEIFAKEEKKHHAILARLAFFQRNDKCLFQAIFWRRITGTGAKNLK